MEAARQGAAGFPKRPERGALALSCFGRWPWQPDRSGRAARIQLGPAHEPPGHERLAEGH